MGRAANRKQVLAQAQIEEAEQVFGEFLFEGHESNTKKSNTKKLLKMWNERQILNRNNQENSERKRKEKSTQER